MAHSWWARAVRLSQLSQSVAAVLTSHPVLLHVDGRLLPYVNVSVLSTPPPSSTLKLRGTLMHEWRIVFRAGVTASARKTSAELPPQQVELAAAAVAGATAALACDAVCSSSGPRKARSRRARQPIAIDFYDKWAHVDVARRRFSVRFASADGRNAARHTQYVFLRDEEYTSQRVISSWCRYVSVKYNKKAALLQGNRARCRSCCVWFKVRRQHSL